MTRLQRLLAWAREGEVAVSVNTWPSKPVMWARIYVRLGEGHTGYVGLSEGDFLLMMPHLEQVRVEPGRSEVTRFYKVVNKNA